MPVKAKSQVLAKVETSEGIPETLAAADALTVFTPDISDDTPVTDRRPAGPSLSRDLEPVGLSTRTITYTADMRPSGSVGTVPPFGKLIRPCGFDELPKLKATLTGLSGLFLPSEIIQVDADNYGLVLGPMVDTDKLHFVALKGQIASDDVVAGLTSGASATATPIIAEGVAYRPTSRAEVLVSTGTWSGTAPVVGDVLTVASNVVGVGIVGAIQITEFVAGTQDFKAAVQWGTIANLNVLTNAAGVFASVDAAITQAHSPSLTQRINIDGRYRDQYGARGNLTMSGENGTHISLAMTFLGQRGTDGDAALLTGGPVQSNIGIPKLQGASVGLLVGTNFLRFRGRRFELAMNNQLGLIGDWNQPGGVVGTSITDRDPLLTLDLEWMGKTSFDLINAVQNSTPVGFSMLLGSSAGNRLVIAAPRCQIVGYTDGDADGRAIVSLQLKPRRYAEGGDDEFAIAQL